MNTLTGIEADRLTGASISHFSVSFLLLFPYFYEFRVVQVLKHAIDRLQIISYLPTNWDEDLTTEITTETSLGIVEKLWTAEENFGIMTEGLGPNDLGAAEIELLKQVHRHTRTTCRNLQLDRASLQILISRPELQSEEFAIFIKYLLELKTNVNTRLTTTVEDEATNRSMLHELTEQERRVEESEEALNSKLNDVREEKERTTFSLDQILRKLQLELQDLSVSNKVELETVQRDMSDAIAKAASDHELRVRQLQDQLDNLERQSNEVVEKNKDEEQKLRKEKNRSEHVLCDQIQMYDKIMERRRYEFQNVSDEYQKETVQYSKLKEYFDRIDMDLTRAEDERRILAAIARREKFAVKLFDIAANRIQKVVRGIHARSRVTQMKKSKKGKGKKK